MVEIYGTLGPSCESEETLRAMFAEGMTGIRLNLSHVTLEQSKEWIATYHAAAKAAGVEAKLLIDMQGPELRMGQLKKPLELTEGEEVSFIRKRDYPSAYTEEGRLISIPHIVLYELRRGQQVLLDDGKILIEVLEQDCEGLPPLSSSDYGMVRGRVLRGGKLRGRKSIALPGVQIHPPTLTLKDLDNLAVAMDYGVTGVMQPFVRDAKDLKNVKRALKKAGAEEIRLFAKIENMEGVEQLEELLPYADEIVIARGDLGNAVPLWDLPKLQKQIAATCRAAEKPFMVVTQMLTSMEKNLVPTRAEVSDIYNAVCEGASSVMVTGETAVGDHPVEVIRYLANTVRSYE